MMPADVLVVDDDAATRQGLCALLLNAGFSTEPAGDGAEALEKIGCLLYTSDAADE